MKVSCLKVMVIFSLLLTNFYLYATDLIFINSFDNYVSVEDAIETGDVRFVDEDELLDAILSELGIFSNPSMLLYDIYGNDAISYIPTNRSATFAINYPWNTVLPLVYGNAGQLMAMLGTYSDNRFAVYGKAVPKLFEDGTNLSYQGAYNRVLAWLLTGDATDNAVFNSPRSIGIAYAGSDKWDIISWFSNTHTNWSIEDCDVATSVTTCLSQSDLMVIGKVDPANPQQAADHVISQFNSGKPLLYLHTQAEHLSDLSGLLSLALEFTIHYGGNFWANDQAVWTDVDEMYAQSDSATALQTYVTHLKNRDFNFNWNACNGENCSAVPGWSEADSAMSDLLDFMENLDKDNFDIFSTKDFRLHKMLILLADMYRQNISFPMDKHTSDDNDFMRAWFADHTVYNSRYLNPAQADMGNFSRSNFSHVTPINEWVNIESKVPFRSTGVYALPGQTVRVTRTDNSDTSVSVFVSTQRSESTHQFQGDGYKRPKNLRSVEISIDSGQSIYFTSPYGGPIQLMFDNNNLAVDLHFENVGKHPYWAGLADTANFAQKLLEADYDWA